MSRKNTKFPAHLVAAAATQPRETSCNFVGDGNCFLSAFVEDLGGPSEMSTYFYRMCSTARRAQRCVSIYEITGMLEMSAGYTIGLKEYIYIYFFFPIKVLKRINKINEITIE